MTTIPCVSCQGTGQIGEDACSLCGGDGERNTLQWGITEAHLMAMLQLVVNTASTIDAIKAKTDNLPEDIADDIADIKDKCNDIFEKVNE